MQEVEITKEPVELYKILKFEGLTANGGEAKAAVSDGQVKLNGTVETQRRKKVYSGDVIEFAGQELKIQMSSI